MTTDVYGFGKNCEELLEGSRENAILNPLEPELDVSVERSDSLGHFLAVVNITPDHMTQEHRFEFEIDQTFLRQIIIQCQLIVKAYSIRGETAAD